MVALLSPLARAVGSLVRGTRNLIAFVLSAPRAAVSVLIGLLSGLVRVPYYNVSCHTRACGFANELSSRCR